MNTPKPSDIFRRPSELRADSGNLNTINNSEHVAAALEGVDISEIAGDEAGLTVRATDHELGNPELPIAQYRDRIIEAVTKSQATVITAETGAGKSTQVPQFLAEAGYDVIVTQPRVVAARSVAERVRDEVTACYGEEFKDFVGYRTARERGDNPANQILFATDGLQLVRELSGHGVGRKQVLVLDEVHEWNENMEVLVAWAKQHIAEDPNFRVVTMSATMEADKLSKYFANGDEREVPVIEVPGRTFEVRKSEGGDVADQAIKMARDGKNTLVFVPGKAEIDQAMAEIARANAPGTTILPLHGQLEAAEQSKVFAKYPGVKIIVATNVAQTSITIDDIDAVVDSGLERQKQVRNGVEGLYLNPISQADCLQRAGRAGRTKEGEYVLAQLGNNPFVLLKDRELYGTPEILRTRLDGMVLRLAKNGFDAATMDFYHSKDEQGRDIKPEIAAAKERLQRLGALREDDSITKIGRDMERMPVESHYARMMIEARKYGSEVQIQLAALLAVQEADGIIQFDSRNRPCAERWRGLLEYGHNDSDMIKQLEVFAAVQSMSDKQKRDHDVYVKACSKAREVLRQLRAVEKLHDQDLTSPSVEQREQLVKCIVSGMVDHLYIEDWQGYRDATGNGRDISSRGIIQPEKMVVGVPFDLQVTTRRGPTVLHLIESPTNVPSVALLREVAPQLFAERSIGYAFDEEDAVCERFEHIFNGHATGEVESRPAVESAGRTALLARETAKRYWLSSEIQHVVRIVDDLRQRSGEDLQTISQAQLEQVLLAALPLSTVSVTDASQYLPKFTVDDLVNREDQSRIRQASPDTLNGLPLRYDRGSAIVDLSGLDESAILALDSSMFVLPDGRQAACRTVSWQTATPIAEYQGFIVKEQQRRGAEELARHERHVREALRYMEGGYGVDYLRDLRYSEAALTEAIGLYMTEIARVKEERRQEEAQRQREREALTTMIDKLLAQNETIYLRSELERLDEAPDEIRDAIYDIRDRLDAVKSRLENARQSLEWGYSLDGLADAGYRDEQQQLSDKLQQQEATYRRWVVEQKQRETGSVAAVDLEALMRHFNG